MKDTPNDIQAAIEAGKALAAQQPIVINDQPLLLVPNDMRVDYLAQLAPRPQRPHATVTAQTPDAFIDYFNHFADDDSAIFIDRETGKCVGIIDYHSPDAPAWGEHRVVYRPVHTPEAKAWLENSGTRMDQEEFALFLERNAEDISTPPAAEMLEIATTLKVKTKVTFASAKRLHDGQTQFQYVEEHEGRAGHKGQLTIPETFTIGLRLFEGGDAYALQARFRYRIGNEPQFWYDLIRPHRVREDAIDSITQKIRAGAKCPLILWGTP